MVIDKNDKFAPKNNDDRNRQQYKLLVACQKILGTPEGRSVLLAYSRMCHVWEPDHPSMDQGAMYFRAGRRSAAMDLLSMVKMDPAKFFNEDATHERIG